jgi:hypothetical protein
MRGVEIFSGIKWSRGLPLFFLLINPAVGLAAPPKNALGIFERQGDVGKMQKPGTATFDVGKKEYRLTSGGENIWGTQDAFH